jgi:predicted dinucleotide-binding enzyme
VAEALGRRVGRPTGEAAAGAMVVIAVPWASVPTEVAGCSATGEIVLTDRLLKEQ